MARELTSDIFNRACLLAPDEKIIIQYQFDEHCRGEIVLTHNVQFMKHKTQTAIKRVLEFVRNYITTYYVQDIDSPDGCCNLTGLLHIQENTTD